MQSRFESRVFWLPKDDNAPEQYEDAFACDGERGIAALADGVASGIFSGTWARVLTQAVVAEPPGVGDEEVFGRWLDERRAAWRSQIDTDHLAWYQRPKLSDGAFSTLLWLTLEPVADGNSRPREFRLRAAAIGDCCLFHIRAGRQISVFPLTSRDDFGLQPQMLASLKRQQDQAMQPREFEATCLSGDLVALCTDAVAQWALGREESHTPVAWNDLWNTPHERWRDDVRRLRETQELRYDDTTLVMLRVGAVDV